MIQFVAQPVADERLQHGRQCVRHKGRSHVPIGAVAVAHAERVHAAQAGQTLDHEEGVLLGLARALLLSGPPMLHTAYCSHLVVWCSLAEVGGTWAAGASGWELVTSPRSWGLAASGVRASSVNSASSGGTPAVLPPSMVSPGTVRNVSHSRRCTA